MLHIASILVFAQSGEKRTPTPASSMPVTVSLEQLAEQRPCKSERHTSSPMTARNWRSLYWAAEADMVVWERLDCVRAAWRGLGAEGTYRRHGRATASRGTTMFRACLFMASALSFTSLDIAVHHAVGPVSLSLIRYLPNSSESSSKPAVPSLLSS